MAFSCSPSRQCRRLLSTGATRGNPLMGSPFGSTCLQPLQTAPILSQDADELHQKYADLLLGPELAVPGVGPDTFVTIGRNKCDLIKSIFPTGWRFGVAKVGEGPFQYPHDVADEERAFAFAREAIMKSRPGVLVLGPLSERGDVLANCEYSHFVEMLISCAREVRPGAKVVWDETLVRGSGLGFDKGVFSKGVGDFVSSYLGRDGSPVQCALLQGGFGRVAGARPQLWSTDFFLKTVTCDATLISSIYGLDAGLVAALVDQESDSEEALPDEALPSIAALNREVNGLKGLIESNLGLPTASAYIGGYIYNRLWNELLGRSRVVVDVHHRGCWIAIEVLHDEMSSDKLPKCSRLVSRADHDVVLVCPPFAYEDPQQALPHADELIQCMLDLFLLRD